MICRNVKEAASLLSSFFFFLEKDVILDLFKCFNETLDAAGVFANEGKMVDASYVQT